MLFVVSIKQYGLWRLAFLSFSCLLGLLQKEEAHSAARHRRAVENDVQFSPVLFA